jgi:hypothetical protein
MANHRPEHQVEVKLTEALKGAAELGNEINMLRAALREIGQEVSFVGCEGSDDAICVETTRAKEDWCPWCRVSDIIYRTTAAVAQSEASQTEGKP